MTPPSPQHQRALRRRIERLANLWRLPELPARVRVVYSARLTRSWGRSQPARGRVALNPRLMAEARRHLDEVLAHELAHLAVWLRHGRRAKPHGAEWRALMEQAGQPVRTRLPASSGPLAPRAGKDPPKRWAHRCPVCQMVRVAKRPVRGWRCAACRSAGLEGLLEITPLERSRGR